MHCVLQESLQANHKEILQLTTEKIECETSMAATERQKTHLHTELSSKISELTSKNYEIHSLKGAAEELEVQVAQLQSGMKTLEQNTAVEVSKLQQELAAKVDTTTSKELEADSLKAANKELECRLSQLRSSVETLKQERETSAAGFENQRRELYGKLASKSSELSSKNAEIQSLMDAVEGLEVQVTQQVSGRKTLEQTTADREDKLQQELAGKISALASKECQLKSLEAAKKEVESEASRLRSSMETLREEKGTATAALDSQKGELHSELSLKTSELASKNFELQTLKSRVEGLENQVAQLESSRKDLEQTATINEDKLQQDLAGQISALASKERKIKSLEAANEEMANETALFQASVNALKESIAAKDTELISKQVQLQSVEASERELKSQLSLLRSEVKALEQEKQVGLSSKDCRIQSLEGVKVELEGQITGHLYRIQSQEQDIGTMSTKMASRDFQIESLENINKELESQVTQVQGCYRSLEQNVTGKDAEIESLRRELQREVAEHRCNIGKLENASATMEAELAAREMRVLSLVNTSRGLEEEVAKLQASHKARAQDLALASAKLADSDERASSLVELRDKLVDDVELAHKELSSIRGRNSTIESEVLLKESTLAATREDCSALESKVQQLTQLLADQQACLQSANDQVACLATQKETIECERVRLEANLQGEMLTTSSLEAAVASYRGKLESSEQRLDNFKQHASAHSEQSQLVKELTSNNHMLQCDQHKLYKQLNEVTEREGEFSSCRERLEVALATEKASSRKLVERVMALEEAQLATREEPVGGSTSSSTLVPLQHVHERELCSMESSLPDQPTGLRAAEHVIDDKARLRELKRRNKRALPHLKSSYPIEMQEKQDTPTTSAEKFKHDSRIRKSKQSTPWSVSTPCTPQGTGTESGSVSSRTRRSTQDIDSGHSQGGNLSSSKSSSSAPPTPQPPVDFRRKQLTMQNSAMCPSALNLREFLDETPDIPSIPNSTTFDVAFSPPKATLPKRLQENRLRRKVKETSDSNRETLVVKKPTVGSNSHSKSVVKRILRSKTKK